MTEEQKKFFNPFKENRTEQMRDLWRYYVPYPTIDTSKEALVVEGGRGSGKTMFFQCNSWREQLSKIKDEGKICQELYGENRFVGIYYRVDTTFVSAMTGKEIEDWSIIFQYYLNLCVLREITDLLITLNNDNILKESKIVYFVKTISSKISDDIIDESLISLKNLTEKCLDYIEDIINSGEKINSKAKLRTTQRFVENVIEETCLLLEVPIEKMLFKIFIDEYETLQEYQQKIVNTLIKHSDKLVVYNIGLRSGGMKTHQTISDTETIEPPHDYSEISLTVDKGQYKEILKEICRKRIDFWKEVGKIPQNASNDIEYYLGAYCMEDELEDLMSSDKVPEYLKELEEIIVNRANQEKNEKKKIKTYVKELCYDAPVINSKLHHLLLLKQTKYTPTIEELYKAYKAKNSRYQAWMHNREFGIMFLLTGEYDKKKRYHGFNVFSLLSSNIVRYFLELCEQTFYLASLSNESVWDKPIAPELQTGAAYYVSDYKISDIISYEPYGRELRIFVEYVGKIFNQLHVSKDITLGEPEQNHFFTNDLALSKELRKLLSNAVLWNVLQAEKPTKRKQSNQSEETVDYHLNRIYAPYFGISYRKKRKIKLESDLLEKLLSGDDEMAKSAYRLFLRKKKMNLNDESSSSGLFDELGRVGEND